jgi:hypothetical protein
MTRGSLRPILAVFVAAAACLAVSPRPDAASTPAPMERFVARAPSLSQPGGAAGPVAIMIERWSTDADAENLRQLLTQHGPDALLPALQTFRRPLGVVLIPGIQGAGARVLTPRPKNVLFAREVTTPNGRQVIVATDRSLAFGEPTQKWPSDEEFMLLDIRFGPDGNGVGKLAAPDKVVYNTETKTIELANFAAQTVRLTDVRSEKGGIAPH